jgi:antitoxin (DNA-binding transcriptional repressor) of toxin-antitoxin stability system
MSTATITELGANLHTFLAAVRVGDTVAVMDGGKEIARLVPPAATKVAGKQLLKLDSWAQHRLDELNEIFPEPVLGMDEIMEDSRQDICER